LAKPNKVRQVTVVGEKLMAVHDDMSEERLRIYDIGVGVPPSTIRPPHMPFR